MPVGAGHVAVVRARELANRIAVENLLANPRTLALQVQRPAPQAGLQALGGQRHAAIEPGRKLGGVGGADIHLQRIALFPGVHHVKAPARLHVVPANVARAAVARHHPKMGAALRLPGHGQAAAHRALTVEHQRIHREHHVMFCDKKIVHERSKRHLDHFALDQLAVLIGDIQAHVFAEGPRRLIAEEHHLAGCMIKLGVGGYGAVDLTVEIKVADGRERARVHLHSKRAFHQRQQPIAMPYDMGIGRVVMLVGHGGICFQRVAQYAEQRFAGCALQCVLLGAHPAVSPCHPAARKLETLQHAIAMKPVIGIPLAGRIKGVRSVAYIYALEIGRQFAFNHQVRRITFNTGGPQRTLQKHVVREGLGHVYSPSTSGAGCHSGGLQVGATSQRPGYYQISGFHAPRNAGSAADDPCMQTIQHAMRAGIVDALHLTHRQVMGLRHANPAEGQGQGQGNALAHARARASRFIRHVSDDSIVWLRRNVTRPFSRIQRMPKPWLMGIDLGGSGVRCLLVNTETGELAGSTAAWKVTPAPGTSGTGFDIDLDALYAALGRAAHDVLTQAGSDGGDVGALAISAMRFSSVVLDESGNALLAVPNNDARAAGECFAIAETRGQALLQATGSCPLPMHASARLLWLRQNNAEAFGRASSVYGCGEWLAEQLCGVRAIDATQASASGLFCLHSKDWAWQLIDELALPRRLFPPIVESGSRLGELSNAAGAHLGLSGKVCVAMGGADTQLSLLGAAMTEAGQCAAVAGTTAPVHVVLDKPVLDASGALLGAHHAVPERWVLESNSGAMGYSLSLLARTLFPDAPQPELRLFAEAAKSEPGAAGMLSTLGADLLDLSAPVMPLGQLALSHMSCVDDPAPARHLARAAAEGCACALRANRERLAATLAGTGSGVNTGSMTLCGGLSRSEVFAQLVADIGDIEISVPQAWQTSALGAAVCAGVAAGLYSSFAQACAALCAERRNFAPRQEHTTVNARLFDTWQRFREQALSA